MKSTNKLSYIATAISIVALIISGSTAWLTTLRPAKVSAIMTHVEMWQFSSWLGNRPSGQVALRQILPYLMIKNVGARPLIIEDLRIRFVTDMGNVIVYPVNKVPFEVVEGHGNSKRQVGLGDGPPFSGIILSPGGEWINSYIFATDVASFELLKNDVKTDVEIRVAENNKWTIVFEDVFAFGSMPYHLQPLKSGNAVIGSTSNPVFSKRWEEAHNK